MSTPLFSVIIPCYNRASLVERTVFSVLSQTYVPVEIIIVDDASTDDSVSVIERLYGNEKRIRLVAKKENGGVHTARNAGIEEARGEYLLFLDSDDELYPEALAQMAAVFEKDPAISIVSAPYKDDDGELTGLSLATSGYIAYNDLLTMRVSRKNKAGVPAIRRSALGAIRFVAPNLDYIFYRYLMRTGHTYYIAHPLGIYHKVVAAGSQNFERKLPKPHLSIVRARAIDSFLKDFKDDLVALHPVLFSSYAYSAAVGLLLAGEYTRARMRSREAAWYSKGKPAYVLFTLLAHLPLSHKLLWLFFRIKIRYTSLRR